MLAVRHGSATRRCALATLLASGCAQARAIPPTDLPESGDERPPDRAGAESAHRIDVGSPKSPVLRCGPQDSYDYIARIFRCPDGGNPLAGDADAAASARVGSREPDARGHTVDVYEVPCPSGKVEVYVDMYGCPEMEEELARDLATRDPYQLDVEFARGKYDEVRARCDALADGAPVKTLYHCAMLEPALQLRARNLDGAVAAARRNCESYPPVDRHNQIRVTITVGMALAIAGMVIADKIPTEEASKLVEPLMARLLEACGVEVEAFKSAFIAATKR